MTKSLDEEIERVLAGLREAEAPGGMEGRILQAIGGRGRAGSVGAGYRWGTRAPAWGLGFIALAAALLVIVQVSVRFERRAQDSGTSLVQPSAWPAQSTAPEVLDVKGALRPHVATAAQSRSIISKGKVERSNAGRVGLASSAVQREDRIALNEMRARSVPVPEMPLTKEERLLLRMAHRRDPVLMGALADERNTVTRAREAAHFEGFFAAFLLDATTGDNQ